MICVVIVYTAATVFFWRMAIRLAGQTQLPPQ